MKTLLQTASRGAMIALIAATPVVAFAQSESATEQPKVQQTDPAATETAPMPDSTSTDTATDSTAPTDDSSDVATDETTPTDDSSDVATDEAAPLTDEGSDVATDSMAPADDGTNMAADSDAVIGEDEQLAAEEPAKPVEGQITMQDADTVLAEDLLGATVYNGADENVGDINDLIIGLDGKVEGVVIGVGGFLGLGEREVAVEMASLQVVDNDGSPRLVTSATRTDLENAQEFVSAADQRAEADRASMQSSGDTMGGISGGTTQPIE